MERRRHSCVRRPLHLLEAQRLRTGLRRALPGQASADSSTTTWSCPFRHSEAVWLPLRRILMMLKAQVAKKPGSVGADPGFVYSSAPSLGVEERFLVRLLWTTVEGPATLMHSIPSSTNGS